MLRGGEVFRGLAGTSRRISANTANEYLEILSFGLVDRERERAPAPRVGQLQTGRAELCGTG